MLRRRTTVGFREWHFERLPKCLNLLNGFASVVEHWRAAKRSSEGLATLFGASAIFAAVSGPVGNACARDI